MVFCTFHREPLAAQFTVGRSEETVCWSQAGETSSPQAKHDVGEEGCAVLGCVG